MEANEALKDEALQASMAVEGLLTGIILPRDEYSHACGSQYEQTPEPRNLKQMKWHRAGFRLLTLGAAKDRNKRLGFSLSESMLNETFEEIMSCHVNRHPTLKFAHLALDSRGTSLVAALKEKLEKRKQTLEEKGYNTRGRPSSASRRP
jgi:hypothetical protein